MSGEECALIFERGDCAFSSPSLCLGTKVMSPKLVQNMLLPYTKFQMQSEERLAPGKVCREYSMSKSMCKSPRGMYGAKLNRKSLWTNDECMPSIRRLPRQPEWKLIPWWRDKFAETRGQLDIFISRISNWVSHICLCTLWIFDESRLDNIQYLDTNKVTPPFVTECFIISSIGYDHVSKFF